MAYARVHGFARPQVLTEEPKKTIGVFGETDLDTLMKSSIKDIQGFIVAHEDELFENDLKAMLEWEQAQKKPRQAVVKGLKALIGGA